MKRVKHNALRMMTKELNTWWNMANSKRGEGFETYIKIRWPKIEKADWQKFVASHSGSPFKRKSEWGKGMRKKHKMNHKLDSRGYLGKRKLWAKEDEAAQEAGRDAPLSYLKDGRAKDFLRARATYDLETGQLNFKSDEVAQVHTNLVSS